MKFDIEYGYNNKSLPKFVRYEIKEINNIKIERIKKEKLKFANTIGKIGG